MRLGFVRLAGSELISAFIRVIEAELRLALAMVERPADLFRRFIPPNRKTAELLQPPVERVAAT